MTPRYFELKTPDQRNCVLVAEDRNVHLRERRPDVAAARILDDADGRVGCARYRLRDEEAVGGHAGADGHLHRTARQIEERAVGFDAALLDMQVLLEPFDSI